MTACIIIYTGDTSGNDGNGGTNVPSSALTDTTEGETIETFGSTTMTFSGTLDLTGVGGNDSGDVIWVDTPSGERHLFTVASYTGGVSTCTGIVTDQAADGSDSALAWGIGGKRSTIDNDVGNPDFQDGLDGWEFELEDNGVDYTPDCSSSGSIPIVFSQGVGLDEGPIVIRSAAGDRATIVHNNPNDNVGALFSLNTAGTSVRFEDINLRNEGFSWSGNFLIHQSQSNSQVVLLRVDFDSNDIGAPYYGNACGKVVAIHSAFHGSVGQGLFLNSGRESQVFIGCVFSDNAFYGVYLNQSTGFQGSAYYNCIFRDNGSDGLYARPSAGATTLACVENCVFDSNIGAGIRINGTMNLIGGPYNIINNIITNNGDHGIDVDTAGQENLHEHKVYENFNAFYGNTGSEVANMTQGADDITLTADPYEDAASDDYSLNNAAGGGALCKAAGFPSTWPFGGNDDAKVDIGAVAYEAP